jgi:hypothetical protein
VVGPLAKTIGRLGQEVLPPPLPPEPEPLPPEEPLVPEPDVPVPVEEEEPDVPVGAPLLAVVIEDIAVPPQPPTNRAEEESRHARITGTEEYQVLKIEGRREEARTRNRPQWGISTRDAEGVAAVVGFSLLQMTKVCSLLVCLCVQ